MQNPARSKRILLYFGIQRQQLGAVQVQHLHDQSRGDIAVQLHKLEETLQAAVI